MILLIAIVAVLQNEPVLVGPEVISTAEPEFAASFSPDGALLFFNRASADRSRLSILVSSTRDGRWTEPTTAPFSGVHRDVDPFVSPDGGRLYFSSNRPASAEDTELDFNTWFVDREGEEWSEPEPLEEPLNSAGQEVFVSVDAEGTLYFASDRDGAQRVYRSRWTGEEHEPPQLVPFDVNLETGASNPWIAPRGELLLFVSDREGGHGGADLYATCLVNGKWLESRNLGARVNSAYAEFAPALTPDGRHLVFTSERPGLVPAVPAGERPPGDLYQLELTSLEIPCRP